jgi:hypothetical protein
VLERWQAPIIATEGQCRIGVGIGVEVVVQEMATGWGNGEPAWPCAALIVSSARSNKDASMLWTCEQGNEKEDDGENASRIHGRTGDPPLKWDLPKCEV